MYGSTQYTDPALMEGYYFTEKFPGAGGKLKSYLPLSRTGGASVPAMTVKTRVIGTTFDRGKRCFGAGTDYAYGHSLTARYPLVLGFGRMPGMIDHSEAVGRRW